MAIAGRLSSNETSQRRNVMPVIIEGKAYYRTREACRKAGISKATLFRRFDNGVLEDTMNKDGNGWRLFSEDDIYRMIEDGEVRGRKSGAGRQLSPFEKEG